MGWTYFNRVPPGGMKAAIVASLTFESDGCKARVLQAEQVGSTVYAAVQIEEADSVRVRGVVGLIDGSGYKLIGEECGPCAADCPPEILALLSPTESAWAQSWRAKCAARAQ